MQSPQTLLELLTALLSADSTLHDLEKGMTAESLATLKEQLVALETKFNEAGLKLEGEAKDRYDKLVGHIDQASQLVKLARKFADAERHMNCISDHLEVIREPLVEMIDKIAHFDRTKLNSLEILAVESWTKEHHLMQRFAHELRAIKKMRLSTFMTDLASAVSKA